MADDDTDLEDYIEAAAVLAGISLADANRGSVIANFRHLMALYQAIARHDDALPADPLDLYRP